ncbi:MAG: glycosyltransferase [Bacteroidetes bacterium]|nr:MAG: glycosyltransferase [Bacteroidota bacterium]
MRPRLLLLTPWFVPGVAGGGITVSVRRMVELLEADYDIGVLTRWHAATQAAVAPDRWMPFGKNSRAAWLSPAEVWRVPRWLAAFRPDIVHVHGLYDLHFNVLPLVRRAPSPVALRVLSPHGMLDPGALAVRPLKKRLFLFAFRQTGLWRGLRFHASHAQEAAHVRRHFPKGETGIAPQIPEQPPATWTPVAAPAACGRLRLLFLGSVHPKKNLLWLLRLLQHGSVPVHLTIAGPVSEGRYASRCRAAARALSPTVRVDWRGEVPHDAVPALLADHHLLALPTLGENFGHAIFEALAHGRPVLVSTATPWRDLCARQAGFDLPLDAPQQWLEALARLWALDASAWAHWQAGAHRLATEWYGRQRFAEAYRRLFEG